MKTFWCLDKCLKLVKTSLYRQYLQPSVVLYLCCISSLTIYERGREKRLHKYSFSRFTSNLSTDTYHALPPHNTDNKSGVLSLTGWQQVGWGGVVMRRFQNRYNPIGQIHSLWSGSFRFKPNFFQFYIIFVWQFLSSLKKLNYAKVTEIFRFNTKTSKPVPFLLNNTQNTE